MTHDEEMAARGRLVTDYADTKRRMATLEAEADRIGSEMIRFGKILCGGWQSAQVDANFAKDVEPNGLRRLIDDLQITQKRLDQQRKGLADLGLLPETDSYANEALVEHHEA